MNSFLNDIMIYKTIIPNIHLMNLPGIIEFILYYIISLNVNVEL